MPVSATRPIISAALLIGGGLLLFSRLGHYPLWDDEANTAMFGMAVWRTGDASAVMGHNINAYASGAELKDLRNRFIPPLSYFVTAPFVGILGSTAFAARLGFAICGFLTIALIVWWMWRERTDDLTTLLMALAILGNVSFMLYARQCRYYALSLFLSTVLAYQYLHRDHRHYRSLAMGFVSVLLLATNYMHWGAFYACLFVDYVLWGRKTSPFTRRDWVLLWMPQAILGGVLLWIWNPLAARVVRDWEFASWLTSRPAVLLMNLRELNGCEFGVGILILASPLLGYWRRDQWLIRALVGLLVYIVVISLGNPKVYSLLASMAVSETRYIAVLIPLCVFISVRVILVLSRRTAWIAVPIALLAFGTNLLHGGAYSDLGRGRGADTIGRQRLPRSTIVDYVDELVSPNPCAYAAVSEWINENVKPKQSIWVLPNFATYPLMFHAPKAVYAWQLNCPREGQFKDLDLIHFRGRIGPDFVIIFGPTVKKVQTPKYLRVATIDLFWYDLIRPELHWHAFRPVTRFDRSYEAVYIYKRIDLIERPGSVVAQ